MAVNNTLTPDTVPQGQWVWKSPSQGYPAGYFTNEIDFDFFNYAGIHRPVVLYTVPTKLHVSDVTVVSDVSDNLASATIFYDVVHSGTGSNDIVQCIVELQNHLSETVAVGKGVKV